MRRSSHHRTPIPCQNEAHEHDDIKVRLLCLMDDQLAQVRKQHRKRFLETTQLQSWDHREDRWAGRCSLTSGDAVSQNLTAAEKGHSLIHTISASSSDPQHPACSAIVASCNGWRTTGLFPQQLQLAFDATVVISKIEVKVIGVRELRIHSAMSKDGSYDELGRHIFALPSGSFRQMPRQSPPEQHHVFAGKWRFMAASPIHHSLSGKRYHVCKCTCHALFCAISLSCAIHFTMLLF